MPRFDIAYIECTPEREVHIAAHGLTIDDVRDAVQLPTRAHRKTWLDQPDDPRGPRLTARGFTRAGVLIIVYLHPVGVEGQDVIDTWRLGSAWPL